MTNPNALTAGLATAFGRIDLSAAAELQSDGKVKDRIRDDLVLAVRRAGHAVGEGGSHRFDLMADGWACELKMMYGGDTFPGVRVPFYV